MTEKRLGLLEYLRYIEGTDNSRNVAEGEAVLNAGHIILCGRLMPSDIFKIYALVLQTSALNSEPHIVQGTFLESPVIKINEMTCTCKAGNSGQCKHVSAVLIKCTRENLNDLEVLSQTDIKCAWTSKKSEAKGKYCPVPIREMPCFKNVSTLKTVTVNENDIYNLYCSQLPESALNQHRIGRQSNTSQKFVQDPILCTILNNAAESIIMLELSCFKTNMLENCCSSLLTSFSDENLDVIVKAKQNSPSWFEARKFRITGSRRYEIYTYSKGDWDTKAKKYFWPKTISNKFVKHGRQFEADARETFISHTGYSVVECGMLVSHSNSWLGFSPDGIIYEGDHPVALLEIKCLYSGSKKNIEEAIKEVNFINLQGNTHKLKKNHKYYGQIQLGLSILNLNTCYLALYASYDKSISIIPVEFDYDFSIKMLTCVKKKYMENMLHKICMHYMIK